MKKLFLAVLLVSVAQMGMCQFFSYGLKAGYSSSKMKFDNYKFDVDTSLTAGGAVNTASNAISAVAKEAKAGNGFHVGGFMRFKVLTTYIQPEIYYNKIRTYMDIDSAGVSFGSTEVNTHRIDIPILMGLKFGPARINFGPVANINLKSKSDASGKIKNYLNSTNGLKNAKNDATFAMQVGAGLDILKKVTLDVRYEFGLSKFGDELKVGDETFKTSKQHANVFLFSLGYMF